MNEIIKKAKQFANIRYISGIHFDYLRYPGNAFKYKEGINAINYFVKKAVLELKENYKNIIVSTSIMSETTKLKNKYGQDFEFMSKYFDVIIPIIDKKKYKKNSNWIKETTNYYVKKSKYSKIWIGLQTYKNDKNPQKLSLNEITKDSLAAINGKSDGVILFQFGLNNIVNFKEKSFIKKMVILIKNILIDLKWKLTN